jgi:hypothetical protein
VSGAARRGAARRASAAAAPACSSLTARRAVDAYERDLKSRVRRADKEKGEEKEGAGPSTQPTPPLPALVAQAVAEAALPDTPRVTWPCSIERSEKELAAAASELQAQSVEILRSLAKVQFRPMPMPPQQ